MITKARTKAEDRMQEQEEKIQNESTEEQSCILSLRQTLRAGELRIVRMDWVTPGRLI